MLAALLMAPRSVIPLQRLVDVLWTEDPPATAVKQVQNVVSSLRGRLGDTTSMIIITDGPGYRVMVRDDELDALRFRRGVEAATALAAEGQLAAAVS
ncbi:MAG: AfsR/SARP family transcriptional regulator, partial [Actinomycetes bacterium]